MTADATKCSTTGRLAKLAMTQAVALESI